MKALIALGLTLSLVSSTAFAVSITFATDSKLPAEIQAKITAAVSEKCPGGLYGIREAETTESEVTLDRVVDYFYDTRLVANYLFDGVHPVSVDIYIKSAAYAISNPAFDPTEIISLSANALGMCN